MRWAGSFEHTRTLGVTATLIRGDGRGSGDLFESVADERGIGWAVEHGWLVPPHGRAVVHDKLCLDRVAVRTGDYADNELGMMITQDAESIVKAWMNNASNRITVAFTPTVASALALREAFTAQGVACAGVQDLAGSAGDQNSRGPTGRREHGGLRGALQLNRRPAGA